MTDAGIATEGINLLWQQGIAFAVMALVIIYLVRDRAQTVKHHAAALKAERDDKNLAVKDRNELTEKFIAMSQTNIQTNERMMGLIKQQLSLQRGG